ncbi:hypothetical protein [Ekhidna sp.]|uniref:hypothetical protein n=1 Tax=Ekhidna sp. TaxID=2608089 RepID=UPI003296DDC7
MMDMNQEDELLKRLFEESKVKSRANITEKVMHRIDVNPKAFEYEPIISKKAWVIIGSIFAITLFYLLINSSGFAFEAPEAFQLIKNKFLNIGDDLSFRLPQFRLPEIPRTMLAAIAAINVIGIYLLISVRWRKSMFK